MTLLAEFKPPLWYALVFGLLPRVLLIAGGSGFLSSFVISVAQSGAPNAFSGVCLLAAVIGAGLSWFHNRRLQRILRESGADAVFDLPTGRVVRRKR